MLTEIEMHLFLVVVKWRQFLTSGDQDATSQSARMSRKIGCFANRYTGLADKELSALYHYLLVFSRLHL